MYLSQNTIIYHNSCMINPNLAQLKQFQTEKRLYTCKQVIHTIYKRERERESERERERETYFDTKRYINNR